jgi:hypothetical protein
MLNQLGHPNTASFAMYAYCAGLHLDNDKSVTHGWMIKCGKEASLSVFSDFSKDCISQ